MIELMNYDIFLGTVENVLPGIDAAFIDIGESEKNGFIHVSDLGPLRLKKGNNWITRTKTKSFSTSNKGTHRI